ncbi:VWA domain-containing protein [Candidatus Peregrinibacteria bacterium]|nr:VWA domain-containing protein [Candidatus Peregrinibacteria bacterium]
MRKFITFVFLILSVCGWATMSFAETHEPAAHVESTYVEIIFDGSGSMSSWLYSSKKIDIAKEALSETLEEVEGSAYIGLRAYGLVKGDCQSSELLVDFGLSNRDEIGVAVDELKPVGMTPLAYSVAKATEDLKALPAGGLKKIIVIGDGQETCEGDISEVGMNVKDAGIDLDALYLGGNDQESESLEALADAAGGDFYSSHVPDEFGDMLADAFSNIPSDFDLPPMDDLNAGAGDFGISGVSVEEQIVEDVLAENFEQDCKIPYKVGDQVLYEEYTLEEVEKVEEVSSGLEVILDVSGSMAGQVEGKAKIDLAREALGVALENLTDDIDLALRVYGHRILKTDQVNSCKDIELLIPFYGDNFDIASKNNAMRVQHVIDNVNVLLPRGWTPIGASLKLAAEDLKDFDNKVILLLSDGEETCDGDPVGVMKRLRESGVEVTVHTVGFDVDVETAAQLRAISEVTGGTYIDAGSSAELKEGLKHIVEEATREVNDCPTLFTNPIAGGETIEEAVSIEPGAYTFDRHLEKGEKYFFKLPVKSGQVVKVYGMAARPSIVGNADEGYAEQYIGLRSTFDVTLHVPGFEGRKNPTFRPLTADPLKSASVAILEDGDFIIETGYDFGDVHKDNIFSVEVEDHYDVTTGEDISEDEPAVLDELEDGGSGGLGLQDEIDTFIIPKTAQVADVFTVEFDDPEFKAQLDIYDENNKLRDRVTDKAVLVTGENVQPGDMIVLKDRNIKSDNRYSDYRLKIGASATSLDRDLPKEIDTEAIDLGGDAKEVLAQEKQGFPWWYILIGVAALGGGYGILRRKKD